MTCHILSPVLFFENHLKAAHFVRPLYDKLVSIGSTLLTLLPPKNAVFFPTGMHLPVGNSFDVRKVIGSSPISSTKPDRKVGLFFLSSGKSLAVGQIIGPGPESSTKPDRKVGLFSFLLVGNAVPGVPQAHENNCRTPAISYDLPTCHSHGPTGLAMTWYFLPGPSFGGAIRTPREGCPYGK